MSTDPAALTMTLMLQHKYVDISLYWYTRMSGHRKIFVIKKTETLLLKIFVTWDYKNAFTTFKFCIKACDYWYCYAT